jgi:hypothetical protein
VDLEREQAPLRVADGSTMTVISNDGDWASIQGMNPDLIVVDEECDEKLWNESKMRRRGDRAIRFVISATATRRKRWMYHQLYVPWVEYHQKARVFRGQ